MTIESEFNINNNDQDPKNREYELELLEATGIAAEQLREKGDLHPYHGWMGVGINEKMYPDEMIKKYIRWGSEKSETFLLVIADDIQAYNRIPFSKKNWDEIYNVEKFRKQGAERKKKLQEWLQTEGINNVEIKQWHEITNGLEKKDEFYVNYSSQLFSQLRRDNPDLQKALMEIAPTQAPAMFEKMKKEGRGGDDLTFGKFAASLYAHDEILLTWLLATKGGYNIKIGHQGEKVYDQITADLLAGKYGGSLADPGAKFGSVYLKEVKD